MSINNNIISLAPWIYNRPNYYCRDHPKYHPDTNDYQIYWDEQLRRSIYGYWVLDQENKKADDIYDPSLSGGWRFLIPQHYWYITFVFLQHLPKGALSPITQLADLRDIDLFWFYNYFIALGFSGFDGDDEISCHELLGRYELHMKVGSNLTFDLTPKELELWNDIKDTELKSSNGNIKKYMHPLDYLSQTFTKPLGKPLYTNTLFNISDLESRGSGKTYRLLGILSHAYNTFGAKSIKDFWTVKKGPTLCVGSIDSGKSSSLLSKFEFSQNQLLENFGSYTDPNTEDFYPGFFHKEHMGTLNVGNEKNQYRHVYKIKKGNSWKKLGTWTSILHRTYDNPEAFVGNRSILMLEDEFGLNEQAVKCARADNTVMKMSGQKIGIAVKTGTGGNMLKVVGSKEIYYNGSDYGYLVLPDKFENHPNGIGIFVPAYYVDSSFRDKNGNQDIVKAHAQEMHNRKKLLDGNSNAMLDAYIIDHPIVPSEMFLSPETNIFPVTLLREHRAKLVANRTVEKIASFGDLEYTNTEKTEVKWIPLTDRWRKPILNYDLKPYEGNYQSCIIVYEHPVDNIPDSTYTNSLYKQSTDPVLDDNGGPSMYATAVYKGLTAGNWNMGLQNTIVAEYCGRVVDVDDLHEISIKLAIYYGCKNLPEINIPDIIRYYKRRRKIDLLQPKPWDAISKIIHNPSKKYEFGIVMNHQLIIQAEQLFNKWLQEVIGTDDDNRKILRLHQILSLRLLDELIIYDRVKNTDLTRVLLIIMLWIYQEELVPVKEKDRSYHKSTVSQYFDSLQKKQILNARQMTQYYEV